MIRAHADAYEMPKRDVQRMKTLFVLNDPPYGTERTYNGLRLAGALAKRDARRSASS